MYIHSSGILHRDISPYNILLNGMGRAMFADYGESIFIEQAASSTGVCGVRYWHCRIFIADTSV